MKIDPQPPRWLTVAEAAVLMNLGKRGGLKRLVALDRELEGRLLKVIGKRDMGSRGGVQPGKYMVNLDVLRQSTMEPDREQLARELEAQGITLIKANQRIEALRRSLAKMQRFLVTLGFTPAGTGGNEKPNRG
jgi:hypothetical protein